MHSCCVSDVLFPICQDVDQSRPNIRKKSVTMTDVYDQGLFIGQFAEILHQRLK